MTRVKALETALFRAMIVCFRASKNRPIFILQCRGYSVNEEPLFDSANPSTR